MVRKKDLLKRIENLESSNKALLTLIAEMNDKLSYVWKEEKYKEEDYKSLLDEWVNGKEEEGDDK